MGAKTKIAAAIVLSTACGTAQADDFADGWCAGYNQAVAGMDRNRSHWRSLLRAPDETSQQTLDRIYASPWFGPLAPRRLDQPEGTPQPGPDIVDSADLYLMVPKIAPGTEVNVYGRVISCR